MMVKMVRGGQVTYVGAPGEFNWWTFFFSWIYAAFTANWKLFWMYALVNMIGFVAGAILGAAVGNAGAVGLVIIFYVVAFVVHVLMCFEANEWRIAGMQERAWRVVEDV